MKEICKKRRRALQKVAGLFLIGIAVAILVWAAQSPYPEDKDVTGVLFIAPLGLYLFFTKRDIFMEGVYDDEEDCECNSFGDDNHPNRIVCNNEYRKSV